MNLRMAKLEKYQNDLFSTHQHLQYMEQFFETIPILSEVDGIW